MRWHVRHVSPTAQHLLVASMSELSLAPWVITKVNAIWSERQILGPWHIPSTSPGPSSWLYLPHILAPRSAPKFPPFLNHNVFRKHHRPLGVCSLSWVTNSDPVPALISLGEGTQPPRERGACSRAQYPRVAVLRPGVGRGLWFPECLSSPQSGTEGDAETLLNFFSVFKKKL